MDMDEGQLPEASGLVVSQTIPDTYYQVNDSGDGAFIYASNAKTKKTSRIKINSFSPTDVEDLAYASCGKSKCLLVADIGDNKEKRKTIAIAVLDEGNQIRDQLTPTHVVTASYPDGPHNAESLAVHPNGDIFIVTKEKTKKDQPMSARIYRLKNKSWSVKSEATLPLEFVADLKIPASLFGKKASGRKITSMDIHPDGKKFILLSYEAAIEFDKDLSQIPEKSQLADSYKILSIPNMPKQESIAYSPDGKGFYFTSEINTKKLAKAQKKGQAMQPPSLMYVACTP